jgi:hypothetical protein
MNQWISAGFEVYFHVTLCTEAVLSSTENKVSHFQITYDLKC